MLCRVVTGPVCEALGQTALHAAEALRDLVSTQACMHTQEYNTSVSITKRHPILAAGTTQGRVLHLYFTTAIKTPANLHCQSPHRCFPHQHDLSIPA